MCGRYVAAAPPSEIAKYFGVDELPETVLEPNYNVAPTTSVLVVSERQEHKSIDAMRWGLVPFWAKDLAIGSKMINARAEGIETKNAYRHALKKQRCIIPVDGFYEWKTVEGEKRKQPYFIHRVDHEPLAFAGLWETWRGPDRNGDPIRSCTIVTTSPNREMAQIHHRMPVILPPDKWDHWLDPSFDDTATVTSWLVPATDGLLTMYEVSTGVNNVRNKGPELIVPLREQGQGTLL